MGWFSRSKKEKSAPESTSNSHAPGTGLSYDPSLITRFEGHHQILLKLFGEIQSEAGNHNFDRLYAKLKKFKNVLQEHLLEENLRLYAYMQRCMKNDSANAELMRDMKSEMSHIGRDVNQFIVKYTDEPVDENNVQQFQQELTAVGEVLVERIEREENHLYPLYMRPEQYA